MSGVRIKMPELTPEQKDTVANLVATGIKIERERILKYLNQIDVNEHTLVNLEHLIRLVESGK